jgi:hypothetical protein
MQSSERDLCAPLLLYACCMPETFAQRLGANRFRRLQPGHCQAGIAVATQSILDIPQSVQ